MKVHFREKYLNKKGILDLSSEVEEILSDEEVDYQNMNVRGEKYIWIMCNDKNERQKIRDLLLSKEYTLVIESDSKRFFGKFASKPEKDLWRENNKPDETKKNKLDL